MAKAEGPGFADKHIEKVVFLLCLLVLLYALMQYGVSSKRTYRIAGEEGIPPKQIDQHLLSIAQRLEKRIEDVEPPAVEPRKDLAILNAMLEDPLPTPPATEKEIFGVLGVESLALSYGSPGQLPLIQGMEGPEKVPTLAKLIEVMPAPAKPVSWAGPEIILYEKPALDTERAEIKIEEPPTWRAVSWYPFGGLREAWLQLLGKTVVETTVIALGYETEIQVKQPDGTWKTTDDVKPVLLPIVDSRTGEANQPEPLPEYTGANGEIVRQWYQDFGAYWTPYQLQPAYHEVWLRNCDTPTWEAHFPAEVLDVYPAELHEDAEGQPAIQRNNRSSATRGGTLAQRMRSTASATRRTTARTTARTAAPREPEYMDMPPDMDMPPEAMMRRGAVPPRGAGATLPRGRATVRRTTSPRPGAPTPIPEEEEEEEPPVVIPEIPEYQEQLALGKVLMWFHVNNIQLGREYRCRFRMVFANPLLTHDKDLQEENKRDAYVPSVRTKWSEWSDPIRVKREVDFFVTGSFPKGKSITVTIFTKWMDQRLMYPISKIKAGRRIQGQRPVKVLNPATGEPMRNPEGIGDPVMEFDTGATVIRLDFDRRIQTEARSLRDDVELIYLDPQGRLCSRSMYRDKNSTQYKELEAEAKKAAAVFEPERPVRPKKEEKKRELLAPEFEVPNLAPSDRDIPGQGNPFEVPDRTRDRSSRSGGSSRDRSSRGRSRD
ncbi:MAG: hypothetical protein JXA11_12690 [Phycisphaerae bacterium]|nr:hypothetical protein [Phycisphaerae bacterium]